MFHQDLHVAHSKQRVSEALWCSSWLWMLCSTADLDLGPWLPHGGSNVFKVTCRSLGVIWTWARFKKRPARLQGFSWSPLKSNLSLCWMSWQQATKKLRKQVFTSKWQWLKTTASHRSPSMNTEPQPICSRTFTQSAIYDSSSNYLIWSHPCYANFPLKWWQISLI